MFCCFAYEHEICIHRAKVTGSSKKPVDDRRLMMEDDRCMSIILLAMYVIM